jgi:energy-coupling factor transport system ATP-binding protein
MGLPVPEIERRVDESLSLAGLIRMDQRSPRTLSGGEQKRLALASVLAMRPQLLILDEPTAGLDPRGRRDVLATINRLRLDTVQGMTVVMATQDAQAVARFADRIIILKEGQVALEGSPAQVFARVEQMDVWGIDVPQLARLAHGLQRCAPHEYAFYRLEEACQALNETNSVAYMPTVSTPDHTQQSHSCEQIIKVRNLSYRYPAAKEKALSQITLDIHRGEWLAVIGINGSGKSTLIKHLNGLLKPTDGAVYVAEENTCVRQVGELARTVSYLPQNPDHLIFCATVRDEVAYGPQQQGLSGKTLDDRVVETLDMLSLSCYVDHPPAVLSYSVRRQVALASVLAMNAPVLVLDEPAVGLNRGKIVELMNIISRRHRDGTTVIMITHDLQLVAQYAQRVVILHGGHLVAQGPPRAILTNVDGLRQVNLEPLPVTTLAYMLRWSRPLPLSVQDVIDAWTT